MSDAVAVTSVVTGGVVGLAGVLVAYWSARNAASVAREGQVQERRIDAYVDALRLIEHKTLWYRLKVDRIRQSGDAYGEYIKLPQEPRVDEDATLAALLSAFGSSQLVTTVDTWTQSVEDLKAAFRTAQWNWEQTMSGPDDPIDDDDLRDIETRLAELTKARDGVKDQVGTEISATHAGQRPPIQGVKKRKRAAED